MSRLKKKICWYFYMLLDYSNKASFKSIIMIFGNNIKMWLILLKESLYLNYGLVNILYIIYYDKF